MKKILIDINIIFDFLNKANDHESAAVLFDMCLKKNVKGLLCPLDLIMLSCYFERKKHTKEKTDFIIKKLLDIFSIAPLREKTLREALYSSVTGYENAVLEALAIDEKIDYIITRNMKDFKKSQVKCCSVSEALLLLN